MLCETSTSEDVLAASDEELIRFCEESPRYGSSHLRRLSTDIVCKIGVADTPDEYNNQLYAWERLNGDQLRIPKPWRFVYDPVEGTGYLLMELIEGSTLAEALHDDPHTVEKVVTAILFMQEQCSGWHHKPGPVSGRFAMGFPWGLHAVETEFQSLSTAEACMNRRLLQPSRRPSGVHGSALDPRTWDIVPRNIIITPLGGIALVDWESACFYPAVLESAALYWNQSVAYHQSVARDKQQGFFDKVITGLLKQSGATKETLHLIERVHVVSIGRLFLG